MLAFVLFSCSGQAPAPTATPAPVVDVEAPAPIPGPPPVLAGPVIPANDPSWAQMQGFLDDPAAYGLADWRAVRVEVAAHVAVIGRDLARERAAAGDWDGCAAAYGRAASGMDYAVTRGGRVLAETVTEGKAGRNGRSKAIAEASAAAGAILPAEIAPLRDALARDQAMCAALAEGTPPGAPGDGVARLRALRMGAAAPEGSTTPDQVAASVRSRLAALGPDPSTAALRAEYADAVDPFVASDAWAPFDAAEVERQLAGAIAALRAPAPADALAASKLAAGALAVAAATLTTESLVGVPAQDPLVEVAAFPGIVGRGRLAMLGPDDVAHGAWLSRKAADLAKLDPEAVPAAIGAIVADLETRPYGSRHYNIRKAQYAALRALASSGHPREALQVLGSLRPLRAQDWAGVDRPAALTAIEGRLLLIAGDSLAASTLEQALTEVQEFLVHVADAEAKEDAGTLPGE